MTTDTDPEARLRTLGARRIKLTEQLKQLEPELKAAIAEAHQAGVQQKTIATLTGFTRDSIYAITNPDVQRTRNARRRKGEE